MLRYYEGGEPVQLLVAAYDVTDQVALRQQVTHLTFHDGLTGLPNRAYVEERTRDVLSDPAAAGRTGVIFLDLDHFTAVNDSAGHGAGDLLLAQAARRLRAVVPVHDTVARWGSDEFAVLVENAGSVAEVAEIADRLAEAVAAEPFRVADQNIALTASVGVALADSDPPGLVLRNADVAMSRARDAAAAGSRCTPRTCTPTWSAAWRLCPTCSGPSLAASSTLQYQPVVDLATSRVIGAEAGPVVARATRSSSRGSSSTPPRSPVSSSRSGTGCCARPAPRARPGSAPRGTFGYPSTCLRGRSLRQGSWTGSPTSWARRACRPSSSGRGE